MEYKSVAIDGPSGAGKSTLARQAAENLGFLYVDTGAIYRTVALSAVQRGIDPADGRRLSSILPQLEIRIQYAEDGLQHMILNGVDVSSDIRRHEISQYASTVSAIPQVREFLLDLQRQFARTNHVIMDGRDIGTVVLPNADVKIYLTASAEVRAKRRCLELAQRGQSTSFDTVLHDIIQRDKQDMERPIAPLRKAEDAIELDTSQLDLNQSLSALLALIRKGLAQ